MFFHSQEVKSYFQVELQELLASFTLEIPFFLSLFSVKTEEWNSIWSKTILSFYPTATESKQDIAVVLFSQAWCKSPKKSVKNVKQRIKMDNITILEDLVDSWEEVCGKPAQVDDFKWW